jgi:hypothetical protein
MARIIVRLELTPQTKKCLNKAHQASRMKQLKMISRLIEWFGNQSHTIQTLIMGHVPPSAEWMDQTRLRALLARA